MITREMFDRAHEIRDGAPEMGTKGIRDKMISEGLARNLREQTVALMLSFDTWEAYNKEIYSKRGTKAAKQEKPAEPEKKPEPVKKPDQVKIVADDNTVILQVIELNKLAWKVLHQLNAALAGERGAGIE